MGSSLSYLVSESQSLNALITFFGGGPVAIVLTSQELGTKVNADIAARIVNLHKRDLPIGWSVLGEGASRKVFLGPDNVAYKVLRNTGYKQRGESANDSEFQAYMALKDHLPVNIKLARCFVWNDSVSAMEYIPGDKPDRFGGPIHAAVQELMNIAANNGYPIRDLHGGNIRFNNGVLTAIDYAL
jgi:hypothetical protein